MHYDHSDLAPDVPGILTHPTKCHCVQLDWLQTSIRLASEKLGKERCRILHSAFKALRKSSQDSIQKAKQAHIQPYIQSTPALRRSSVHKISDPACKNTCLLFHSVTKNKTSCFSNSDRAFNQSSQAIQLILSYLIRFQAFYFFPLHTRHIDFCNGKYLIHNTNFLCFICASQIMNDGEQMQSSPLLSTHGTSTYLHDKWL